MDNDTSYLLYLKQKGPAFLPATFYLSSGESYTGVIVAFSFGNADAGETYIVKWHVAPLQEAMLCGRGFLGQVTGIMVLHHHLSKVVFQDGTVINI